MAWSQFQYWRRDVVVPPVITKKPKEYKGTLLEYQIEKRMYRPSEYLEMAELEVQRLNKEVEDYKNENSPINYLDFQGWYRQRKSVYNKRIMKLEKAHFDHDDTRLRMFKQQLIKTFKVDVWDQTLEKCDGPEEEFYEVYKSLAEEKRKILT